jgi:DNA repair photolyase
VLDKQLYSRAKRKQYGFIAVSSATDPYLQAEKKYEMMRAALKVIAKHQFPVHIITKSDLIERDFDLLHTIDENAILPDDLRTTLGRGVIVSFSFSTLDDKVAKIFEPGATPPSFRLKAIEKSLAEGLYTGISLMPLLPHISDTQESLEHMYSTFKALNVKYILSASLTLFGTGKADSKTLMMQAITKYFPELKETYNEYFKYRYQMSNHYKRILSQRLRELSVRFEIPDKIEGSHSKNLKYPLNA